MNLLDAASSSRLVRRLAAVRAKYAGNEPPPPVRLDAWTRTGVLVLLLLLVPSATLYSSHLSAHYDADSLLPSLISLQKLTLFYWGQNRYGNLLPFLTGWIHDINLNFQAQTWLRALGTASIPLFVFEFIGLRKHYLAAYGLALALMFLSFRDMGNYAIWVEAEPYGQSMLILLAAFLLHRRNCCAFNTADLLRSFAVVLLLCLALFANGALILFAFPLWLAYAILYPHRRNWFFIAFLLAAYAVSSLLSTFYGQEYHAAFHYSTLSFQFSNLTAFFDRFITNASAPMFLGYFAVIAAGLYMAQRRHNASTEAIIAPLALKSLLIAVTTMFYIFIVVNMKWTSLNDFAFRYFCFALALIPPVCAAAFIEGISAPLPKILPSLLSAALMAMALFCKLAPFRIPDSFVEQTKRADALTMARIARACHADFVSGDYYLVWPVVFETIRAAQAVGDPHALDLYGLARKGEHLRDEITRKLRASDRVVVVNTDASPMTCFFRAFVVDAVDWPPYASLLATGPLPGGGSWSAIAFDRKPPAPAANRLPSLSQELLHMFRLTSAAHWENDVIQAAVTEHRKPLWTGPFINVPPGKYTIALQIDFRGPATTPLFDWTIEDASGRHLYITRIFTSADLSTRDGTTWATLKFTVPESRPTQGLEFIVATAGNAPFAICAVELRRGQ